MRTKMQIQKILSIALVPLAAFVIDASSVAQSACPSSAALTPPPESPSRGAALYDAKCGGCHSLDANRVGPKHRGVFGRKAGAVPDYHYSVALKKSNIVWTAQALDCWLQNPTAMVPGTKMGFRLSNAQERADIISYLKTQIAKP